MKINKIDLKHVSIPLKKPFKTALRTVETMENTIIMIGTDDGITGFGEAPPTLAITGETNESIVSAIRNNMAGKLIGLDINDMEEIMRVIHRSSERDFSAKAAVDMAIYDLTCRYKGVPLYRYLGGCENRVETDLTISVNEPEEMCQDAKDAAVMGFSTLKIKVGIDAQKDIERIVSVRQAVDSRIKLRLDANQGWTVDQAIQVITCLEEKGLAIELVEQPVKASDLEGMKKVKESVRIPIMADESLFSPEDAAQILQMGAADLLNIKLMKCGGIYKALEIIKIAEKYGIECMVGSMMESKVSLTAAAHLAAAKPNVTRADLDAAFLSAKDPVTGGFEKRAPFLTVNESPGLGIESIKGLKDIG